MKRIVILTGSELRHTFMRKFLALSEDVEVVQSYCEGLEKSLRAIVGGQSETTLRMNHLANREQSEMDFFGLFVDSTPDYSKPIFLPKGSVNQPPYADAIIESRPDLLIAYSCSIIKEPLLGAFSGRFLNVHLGLSPYYRGSGTNYWSLVNNEPEFMGTTFMHIDAGIDTGEIIHQIRAHIVWGDTPSQIGNRLIVDTAQAYRNIIRNFDLLERMPSLPNPDHVRVYKQKDFSEESVRTLYANFSNGLVEQYLANESERCRRVPILQNRALEAIEEAGRVSRGQEIVP